MKDGFRTSSVIAKLLIWGVFSWVLLLAAIAAVTPLLLSTSVGNQLVLDYINKQIPGKIEAESISLSWFSGQNIRNLTLKTPKDEVVLTANQLLSDSSLFKILWNRDLKAEFKQLDLTLIHYHNGETNLEQALVMQHTPLHASEHEPIVVVLNDVNASVDWVPGSLPAIDVIGTTDASGKKGQFHLKIDDSNGYNITGNLHQFPVALFDQLLSISNPKLRGILVALFGDQFNLSIQDAQSEDSRKFILNAKSDTLDVKLAGEVIDGRVRLSTPQPLELSITHALKEYLQHIPGWDSQWTKALNPKGLSITLTNLEIPLNSKKLTDVIIDAGVVIKSKDKTPLLDVKIKNVENEAGAIDILVNGSFKGQRLSSHVTTKFPADATFDTLVDQLNLQGDIAGIPLNVLDQVLNLDQLLAKSFGNQGTLKFSTTEETLAVELSGDESNAPILKLSIDSFNYKKVKDLSSLAATGHLSIDHYHLFKGIDTHWSINGLTNTVKMDIKASPIHGTGSLVGSLQITNWLVNNEIKIDDAGLSGKLNASNISVKANQPIELQSLSVVLNSERLSKYLSFSIHGIANESSNGKGNFKLDGGIEEPLDWNSPAFATSITGVMRNFPVVSLAGILGLPQNQQKKLKAVAGEFADMDVMVSQRGLTGDMNLSIKGSNGSVQFEGLLNQGILTLKKPLVADIQATAELGHLFFADTLPLLSGMIKSDQPIHVEIAVKDFSYPLAHFDIQNVNIGKGSISLGKMLFRNEGQLAKAISVLQAQNSESLLVWFTPLYFHMNGGVISIERIDMLVMNSFPLAAWGKVDLVKQWVDMKIAFSGSAISKAFTLSISDKGDYIQMPLRGPLDNPTLDKAKFMTKIGALVAQASGPHGLIIGSVVQLATNLTEEPIPPPTTSPLPWQQLLTNDEPSSQKKSEDSKPVKEIKKGAGKILKNLFG